MFALQKMTSGCCCCCCWLFVHRYITVTSYWTPWRLKSPSSPLFAQVFVQAYIKENIKVLRYWPLWGESLKIFPFDDVFIRQILWQWHNNTRPFILAAATSCHTHTHYITRYLNISWNLCHGVKVLKIEIHLAAVKPLVKFQDLNLFSLFLCLNRSDISEWVFKGSTSLT